MTSDIAMCSTRRGPAFFNDERTLRSDAMLVRATLEKVEFGKPATQLGRTQTHTGNVLARSKRGHKAAM